MIQLAKKSEGGLSALAGRAGYRVDDRVEEPVIDEGVHQQALVPALLFGKINQQFDPISPGANFLPLRGGSAIAHR